MRTTAGTRPLPESTRGNPNWKRCPRCKKVKSRTLEHFYCHKNRWSSYCRECCLDTAQARNRKHVEAVREMKDNQPCMDCGQRFPYYVLDYDHRPGEVKLLDVSAMVNSSYKWETILAEIAKCDLICANCHRMRTWLRAAATS